MTFLFIHILSDFYLQPERAVSPEQKGITELISRSLPYAACSIFLFLLLIPGTGFQTAVLFLFAHVVINLLQYLFLKYFCISEKNADAYRRLIFWADQLLHVSVFALLSYSMRNTDIASLYRGFLFDFTTSFNLSASAVFSWILKLLLLYKPANILIVHLLGSYRPTSKTDKKETDGKEPAEEEKQAGRFIGMLERLIMAILISIQQYSAVGLVLTAKSIARYDKISGDQAFAEYYLLGTLLSTLVAICISLLF